MVLTIRWWHWAASHAFIAALVLVCALLWMLHGENTTLRRQIGTMVPATTLDELQRAESARNKQFTALIGTYQETFRVLSQTRTATTTTTTVERITERPPVLVPPTPGNPPGTPGSTKLAEPGTPLIPANQTPAARAAASERIVAHLDAGSLLAKCWLSPDAPDQLELLRDPQGRLSSTSPCVASIDDTVRLRQPNGPVASSIKPWELRVGVGVGTLFNGSPYVRGEVDYHPFPRFDALYIGAGVQRFLTTPAVTTGYLEVGASVRF